MTKERSLRSIAEDEMQRAVVREAEGKVWTDPASGRTYTKYDANFLGVCDPHDISTPLPENLGSSKGRSTSPKFSKDAKP